MKKIIAVLAILLVLSACSPQSTVSPSAAPIDSSDANAEFLEKSEISSEPIPEPTPESTPKPDLDYTLFINSNVPNLIMIFGDNYEAGAYSLIYPIGETTGQIEFTTDYLIEHSLELGKDLSTAVEMSIIEVSIVCNERIKITKTGLFTNMSSEEVISWCSENNYEFSNQQNLHSGTEFLSIDYGGLEILYLWTDDIFNSVTITPASSSESWDGTLDWDNSNEYGYGDEIARTYTDEQIAQTALNDFHNKIVSYLRQTMDDPPSYLGILDSCTAEGYTVSFDSYSNTYTIVLNVRYATNMLDVGFTGGSSRFVVNATYQDNGNNLLCTSFSYS